MRFASLRDGSRDGALVLVDARHERCVSTAAIVGTLQEALDIWAECLPQFDALQDRLERDQVPSQPFDPQLCGAPLPRAYEWIDASTYLNHVELARRSRGAALPPDLQTSPLVYQGGSSVLSGPTEPLRLLDASFGLDFEAELAVVLSDVPLGTNAHSARDRIQLMMLANDVTYRNLVPGELEKGFGFFQSKPATAFSPLAVTPDELGSAFRDSRAFLTLRCELNGERVGELQTGPEMHFSFAELIAHISRTRAFCAGTILGSGTISNRDATRGVACLVERRMRERLESGQAVTPYLKTGDRVLIRAFAADGKDVFGQIDQTVI
ncbi:MAG TPA: fumarylacetoacetate hydrolase family protein [Polyangiaceae bacterium]|nr:fumarylacetoacetate hydrolase family protein [Polyangiaceae bacterium]